MQPIPSRARGWRARQVRALPWARRTSAPRGSCRRARTDTRTSAPSADRQRVGDRRRRLLPDRGGPSRRGQPPRSDDRLEGPLALPRGTLLKRSDRPLLGGGLGARAPCARRDRRPATGRGRDLRSARRARAARAPHLAGRAGAEDLRLRRGFDPPSARLPLAKGRAPRRAPRRRAASSTGLRSSRAMFSISASSSDSASSRGADERRDRVEPGELRRPQAALAGDQLVCAAGLRPGRGSAGAHRERGASRRALTLRRRRTVARADADSALSTRVRDRAGCRARHRRSRIRRGSPRDRGPCRAGRGPAAG